MRCSSSGATCLCVQLPQSDTSCRENPSDAKAHNTKHINSAHQWTPSDALNNQIKNVLFCQWDNYDNVCPYPLSFSWSMHCHHGIYQMQQSAELCFASWWLHQCCCVREIWSWDWDVAWFVHVVKNELVYYTMKSDWSTGYQVSFTAREYTMTNNGSCMDGADVCLNGAFLLDNKKMTTCCLYCHNDGYTVDDVVQFRDRYLNNWWFMRISCVFNLHIDTIQQ